ncbi:MAG TPA: YncE family protein [Pyrinomonadaceae bacterium]
MKLNLSVRRGALLAAVLLLAVAARAQTPDAATTASHLLVLNKADNTLAIIEPESLKILGKVTVGEGPHEVVASRDGRTAYVANYGTQQVVGSTISVVDIAARKEVKRIDLGALRRPHGIFEAGGKIYFTAEANRAVARYDPAADKVDWVMGTGANVSHMLVVTPDGKKVYTANMFSDTVTAVAVGGPPTPPNIAHVAVGKTPEGIGISPDGREVWAANRAEGTISIIDTATDKLKETIQKFAALPFRVAFTPDGRHALVPDPEGGELVVFDAATRKVAGRVKIEGAPLGVVATSDSRRAYVTLGAKNGVAAVDLEKMAVTGTAETGKGPDGVAWAQGPSKPAGGGGD